MANDSRSDRRNNVMMHNTDLECIKMLILVFIFAQLGTEGTTVALCCLLVAIKATTSKGV